jgi:hypothetical protein
MILLVVNIYDYIEQIKIFLDRRGDRQFQSSNSVQADLVMRFRAVTGCPVTEAQQFLSLFPSERQVDYVNAAERYHGKDLHDPVEDDVLIGPLFTSICKEVQREIEAWQQGQKELADRSPEVAELLVSGRGLIHRYWSRVKELMWERHGIVWKSPAEMNPWSVFD